MEVVQVRFTQPHAHGVLTQVAWIPAEDKRIKKGMQLTFKDEPETGLWTIDEVFSRQQSENIQRGWGLNLPKTQRTER